MGESHHAIRFANLGVTQNPPPGFRCTLCRDCWGPSYERIRELEGLGYAPQPKSACYPVKFMTVKERNSVNSGAVPDNFGTLVNGSEENHVDENCSGKLWEEG